MRRSALNSRKQHLSSKNAVRPCFSKEAVQYFDSIGNSYEKWRRKMNYYVTHTSEFLSSVIPPKKKVLLIGCLSHELLEALDPELGVGIDPSEPLIKRARAANQNANINYYCVMPEDFTPPHNEKFDYVILLNLVDHSEDVLALIDSLKGFVHDDSRILFSMLNPLWHSATRLASFLKIRIPDFERNLVAGHVLSTALEVKQFKVTEICRRILVPKRIPFLSRFCNQFLSRLPLLNSLCFIQYVFARPAQLARKPKLTCSVIIPCYNEEENIQECVRRVPDMGVFTEIVVVNDGSKDRTLERVNALKKEFRNLTLVTYERNKGKGRAVLEGMKKAKGDVLIILDADMTVPPEELPEFYEAIAYEAADFVSGTRFLYPMEKQAMRLANFLGNIMFSKLVEIIVGSECSDTLCGTKAMRRIDFTNFELEDNSWGDFDYIFHAARHKLKCIQLPVHYKSRVNGVSKMRAFRSGIIFLNLCLRKWAQLP
jgi:2-polyprenyl-3-methyl-5-hydroxy-6-metoxy-1,4-benzoquinol methylase